MPSCDGEPLLAARGLRRSFGRVRVLHDIDLTLVPGEALAVAGPNGAGKSTLLPLLGGLRRGPAPAGARRPRARVLLREEPFAAPGAASADRLRETLRARRADGLGLVIVTPHLAEVWDVATRVAVMVDGRWVCDEPTT